MSKLVHEFNDLNFEDEVLRASTPTLVDFTATWCPPCKALNPIVEDVAREVDGRARVGKLNIDDAPLTAAKYGVSSAPTLIVFADGRPIAQRVGLTSKAKLLAMFDDA